jgi:hypothetical protein
VSVHTIDDGTDDLMDRARLGGVGGGEALCDGRDGELGLEGALDGRSAERRGAQRPGDAAVKRSVPSPMAVSDHAGGRNVLLQHLGGCVVSCAGEGSGCFAAMAKERRCYQQSSLLRVEPLEHRPMRALPRQARIRHAA